LKTDGSVLAQLHPIPKSEPDADQIYDFVLYTASDPRTRTVLFSVYEREQDTIVVLDWFDQERSFHGMYETEEFLGSVAKSEETAMRIQQLMLAAELLAR
jgi:hypothetical protein